MHARIQIYWCRSSIFRHLKLELLTQFPASNDEKYINVVYIWRKFVSFYGYVYWRMTTEISVMYGSEKVKDHSESVNIVLRLSYISELFVLYHQRPCTIRWSTYGFHHTNACNRDFTIQMRVIHCAVLSPFNESWNYALASVSSYKTSDNFTTLASK